MRVETPHEGQGTGVRPDTASPECAVVQNYLRDGICSKRSTRAVDATSVVEVRCKPVIQTPKGTRYDLAKRQVMYSFRHYCIDLFDFIVHFVMFWSNKYSS